MLLAQPKEEKLQHQPPRTVSHALRPPSGNEGGALSGGFEGGSSGCSSSTGA